MSSSRKTKVLIGKTYARSIARKQLPTRSPQDKWRHGYELPLVGWDVPYFTIDLGELGVSEDWESISFSVCCVLQHSKNESLQTFAFPPLLTRGMWKKESHLAGQLWKESKWCGVLALFSVALSVTVGSKVTSLLCNNLCYPNLRLAMQQTKYFKGGNNK